MKKFIIITLLLLFIQTVSSSSQRRITVPKGRDITKIFSDGTNIVYIYRVIKEGIVSDITEFWFNYNGKDYWPFEDVNIECIENRNRFVILAKINNKWSIYDGGNKIGNFWDYRTFKWSPDCTKLAFYSVENQKIYVHAGKNKFGPFDYVIEIKWSPDASQIAYCYVINKNFT